MARQQRWLHWFTAALMGSLYPGAPFARTHMAVELLNGLLDVFGDLINPELVGWLHCWLGGVWVGGSGRGSTQWAVGRVW